MSGIKALLHPSQAIRYTKADDAEYGWMNDEVKDQHLTVYEPAEGHVFSGLLNVRKGMNSFVPQCGPSVSCGTTNEDRPRIHPLRRPHVALAG